MRIDYSMQMATNLHINKINKLNKNERKETSFNLLYFLDYLMILKEK